MLVDFRTNDRGGLDARSLDPGPDDPRRLRRQPRTRPVALPGFVIDAMQAPTALRAKLYVAADGTLEKTVQLVQP